MIIKALIRTAVLVLAILTLAQYVPFIAQHEVSLLIAVVALGLLGIIGKLFVLALFIVALVWFLYPLF